MNFNFTLINEFISFVIFFYFSCFYIFPLIIKTLNNFSLNDFKNKSFIKFNQTLENKLIKNLILIEKKIKKNTNIFLNLLNNVIYTKKTDLLNLSIIEKQKILNKINILFKIKKNKLLIFFLNSLKLSFIKSFKNVYNEILNYNNEFIINYD
ncbi:hypothetical protein MEJ65_00030 [Candidatus Carsonella ruddii]|uniref:Uncharacterized protein n=1 Tax=Carsonella ruddii TaxID=114186 RepID=A0AAJ6FBI8_CARRU|nr:hypothetical protein [Candidatus Carsonella ruddii]WGS66674.1 hypothetical protein MEJ66_00030 [Candidatus Carsonella ruddii]WGS66870.1 hypothetical protein MEJ62_00030 [Candidatus Carsonella ruddii]WGS67062.1 hypothetical protein MEJ60_00030 [Candidatus Carsonella ruddii]WGS67254.1 hypothetical protein MEJ65_00030 [Candidatus Carsonella ruddii]WMC18270.1 MAG: hypothetical protein NU472_00030 [Candidatus Carsonella ruddii]